VEPAAIWEDVPDWMIWGDDEEAEVAALEPLRYQGPEVHEDDVVADDSAANPVFHRINLTEKDDTVDTDPTPLLKFAPGASRAPHTGLQGR
jgi:hypothetical protein